MNRNSATSSLDNDFVQTSRAATRNLGKAILVTLFVVGLLASSTPWWFKFGVLVLGFALFRLIRRARAATRPRRLQR